MSRTPKKEPEVSAAEAGKVHDPKTGRYVDKFDPAMIEDATKLAAAGATLAELAEHFDVALSTLKLWRVKHPEFGEAVRVAAANADEIVKRSLFERATGFTIIEKVPMKLKDAMGNERVEIHTIEKQIPPDTTAQIFWMKNRDKENWKDRHDHAHSGIVEVNHNDPDAARATIARYMERERQRLEGGTLQ